MGDWNLLGGILEEVHIHSTIVGKIWLTILFIFRMLVLGVAAEDVWDDEQNAFVCNTDQPGCKTVCYDRAFPISLIRFWVLQVIFVSAPSLAYMGHALYRIRALEKERRRRKAQLREELGGTEAPLEELRGYERELKMLEENRRVKKAPLRGSLLRTYVIHILTRSVVEVGFILGQYILYGVRLEPLYKCERLPCPNSVDCYISRPTEKTVFMVFMTSIAAVSLFLNIMEISHLGVRKIKRTLSGQKSRTVFKVVPEDEEPPHCNTGFRGDTEVLRHSSALPNCVTFLPSQQQQRQHRPSQACAIQALDLQESPDTYTISTAYLADPQPPAWTESPSGRGSGPKTQDYEDHRPREHQRPTEPPSTGHMTHRRSLATRDLEEEKEEGRKDSMASDFLFHIPRKASFMAMTPSEGSSPSPRGSDESELGSLGKGKLAMMPPPGGRRMSMASRAKREAASDLVI